MFASTWTCTRSGAPTPTEVAIVLLDVSDGAVARGRCRELGPRLRPLIGRSGAFDLQIMTSGSTEHPEPLTLIPWRRWTPSFEAAHFAGEVTRECETKLSVQRGLPLFSAATRAMQELHARCATAGDRRESCVRSVLYVHSDFQETHDAEIQRALRASTFEKLEEHVARVRARAACPPEIALELCGAKETSAGALPLEESVSIVWSNVFDRRPPITVRSHCERELSAPSSTDETP